MDIKKHDLYFECLELYKDACAGSIKKQIGMMSRCYTQEPKNVKFSKCTIKGRIKYFVNTLENFGEKAAADEVIDSKIEHGGWQFFVGYYLGKKGSTE